MSATAAKRGTTDVLTPSVRFFETLDRDVLNTVISVFTVKTLVEFGATCKHAISLVDAFTHGFDFSRIEITERPFTRNVPLHSEHDGRYFVGGVKPAWIVEEAEIARAFGISLTMVKTSGAWRWPVIQPSESNNYHSVDCYHAFETLRKMVKKIGWGALSERQKKQVGREHNTKVDVQKRRRLVAQRLRKSHRRVDVLEKLEQRILSPCPVKRLTPLPISVCVYLYKQEMRTTLCFNARQTVEAIERWMQSNGLDLTM